MKTTCYLVVDRRGAQRITKTVPSRRTGEIAVKLEMEIDDSLFRIPTVSVAIKVDEARPVEISLGNVAVRVHDALAAVGIRAEVLELEPKDDNAPTPDGEMVPHP